MNYDIFVAMAFSACSSFELIVQTTSWPH